MATTRFITDDRSVWVTTFFGGDDRGRCFEFTEVKDGTKTAAVFTQEEFSKWLSTRGVRITDDGIRPEGS